MMHAQSLSFLCFSFAILFTLFELVRLCCPVWAMKLSGRYNDQLERYARKGAAVTRSQLARSVSIDSTITRLLKGISTDEDVIHVKEFRQVFALLLGCIVLTVALTLSGQTADVVDLSVSLIPLAVGMVLCKVANYRCARIANLIDAHFGD